MGLKPMIRIAAFFVLGVVSLHAQDRPKNIKILFVNGKNGKPMESERLLIFLGNSPEEVRFHKGNADLHTDGSGSTQLLNEKAFSYLQVFVDFRTLCQDRPNNYAFSIDEVLRLGAQTPNNCSKAFHPNEPGTLIVYARQPILRERMAW